MSVKLLKLQVFLSRFFFFFKWQVIISSDYHSYSLVLAAVRLLILSMDDLKYIEKTYQISFWSLKSKRSARDTHICRYLNRKIDIFQHVSMLTGKAEQTVCLPLTEHYLSTPVPAPFFFFSSWAAISTAAKYYCLTPQSVASKTQKHYKEPIWVLVPSEEKTWGENSGQNDGLGKINSLPAVSLLTGK